MATTVIETLAPFLMWFLCMEDDDIEEEDAKLPVSMLSGVAVLNIDIPQVDVNGVPKWYLIQEQMDAMKVDKLKMAIESRGLNQRVKRQIWCRCSKIV